MDNVRILFNHFLLMLVLILPADLNAKEINVRETACKIAQQDAQNDANVKLWGMLGFFFLIFGVVAANVIVPDPPAYRLTGKSPEYVSNYIECYRKTICDIQDRAALKGCIAGTCILPFVYVGSVLLMTSIAGMFPVKDDTASCFFLLFIITLLQSPNP